MSEHVRLLTLDGRFVNEDYVNEDCVNEGPWTSRANRTPDWVDAAEVLGMPGRLQLCRLQAKLLLVQHHLAMPLPKDSDCDQSRASPGSCQIELGRS
jgi:hypothetical protein